VKDCETCADNSDFFVSSSLDLVHISPVHELVLQPGSLPAVWGPQQLLWLLNRPATIGFFSMKTLLLRINAKPSDQKNIQQQITVL